MPDLAASTAMAEHLANQRDQYILQLAAAIREATKALAVLDLASFERCTAMQAELCGHIEALTTNIESGVDNCPASLGSRRELSAALRVYRSLLRRSAQWVDSSRNTLDFLTGFSEGPAVGQRLRY